MAMDNSPNATITTSVILFMELEKLASVKLALLLSTNHSNLMLKTYLLITNSRKLCVVTLKILQKVSNSKTVTKLGKLKAWINTDTTNTITVSKSLTTTCQIETSKCHWPSKLNTKTKLFSWWTLALLDVAMIDTFGCNTEESILESGKDINTKFPKVPPIMLIINGITSPLLAKMAKNASQRLMANQPILHQSITVTSTGLIESTLDGVTTTIEDSTE